MKVTTSLSHPIQNWNKWSKNKQDALFKKFYLEHYPKVVGWLCRERGLSVEDANDLFQDALAELLVRLRHAKRPIADPAAYVFSVARNAATSKYKRKQREGVHRPLSSLPLHELRDLGLYCDIESSDGGLIIYTIDGGAIKEEDEPQIVWSILKRPEMKHCRRLLVARFFGSTRSSSGELAEELGYRNAKSFNTGLNKCKQRFKDLIQSIRNFSF